MLYKLKIISNTGFTLIELMLSMALFSMVLVIIIGAFTQINGSFYRATASTKAQEAVRRLSDEVAESVRTNSVSEAELRDLKDASGGDNVVQICSGNTSFYIHEKFAASGSSRVALRLLGVPCDKLIDHGDALKVLDGTGVPLGAKVDVLVGNNLSVHGVFLANGVLSINTLYGDLTSVTPPDNLITYEPKSVGSVTKQIPRCAGGLTKGYQFCATSQMTTVLHNRLK
jgi:prepilin-type N-terminal cleavage/methylation domain-containing protein